jgi:hypothetical protein
MPGITRAFGEKEQAI